jgi:hypothetical protein
MRTAKVPRATAKVCRMRHGCIAKIFPGLNPRNSPSLKLGNDLVGDGPRHVPVSP